MQKQLQALLNSYNQNRLDTAQAAKVLQQIDAIWLPLSEHYLAQAEPQVSLMDPNEFAVIAYQIYGIDHKNPERKSILKRLLKQNSIDLEDVSSSLLTVAVHQAPEPEVSPSGISRQTELPTWFHIARQELSRAEFYPLEDQFSLEGFDQALLALEFKHLRSIFSYQDTNMLSNLFSLAGRMPNGDNLEGAAYNSTAPFFAQMVNAYAEDCIQTQKYAPDVLHVIDQVRNMTIKAMRFQLMMNTSAYEKYSSMDEAAIVQHIIHDSQHGGAEIFTGWEGHFIDIVIQGNTLYRNNGGELYIDASSEVYQMQKPENLTPETIIDLYKRSTYDTNRFLIQRDLHHQLGLRLIEKIDGKTQTEGNCTVHNKELGLLAKFRLFLPPQLADQITDDAISFIENRFLNDYCENVESGYNLHYILARLISYRLLHDKKYELAKTLIDRYFTTSHPRHDDQHHNVIEILQCEIMLMHWMYKNYNPENLADFEAGLTHIGLSLDPIDNPRLQVLSAFLNDKVDERIWEIVRTLSDEQQVFLGFNLLHIAVRNDNPDLVRAVIAHDKSRMNEKDFFGAYPLARAKSATVAQILEEASDCSKYDYEPGNPLDRAVSSDNLPLVQHLIEVGAKPSSDTFLRAARSQLNIQRALAQHYPGWMKVGHQDNNVLFFVSNATFANELVCQGLDPNQRNANGISPFQKHVLAKRSEPARFFMNHPCTLFQPPHRGDDVAEWIQDEQLKQEFIQKRCEKRADLAAFDAFHAKADNANLEPHQLLVRAIQASNIQLVRGCVLKYPHVDIHAPDESIGKSVLALADELQSSQVQALLSQLPNASHTHSLN